MNIDLNTGRSLADEKRVTIAPLLDRQLSPLGIAAIDRLKLKADEHLIDIGCGTGQTLLQLADRVGPTGQVIGLDIANRSVSKARQLTSSLPNVVVKQQDAAKFGGDGQRFNAIFSRFGVMFFDDPEAAFKHFASLLMPSGRLSFVCWRAFKDNELDRLPVELAGFQDQVDNTPFSFADPTYLEDLLIKTGFRHVRIEALDQQVTCGNAQETVRVLTSVGALGKILRENPQLYADAEPPVSAEIAKREIQGSVYLGAAVWIVSAQV